MARRVPLAMTGLPHTVARRTLLGLAAVTPLATAASLAGSIPARFVGATAPAVAGGVLLLSIRRDTPTPEPWWRLGAGLVGVTLSNLVAWQMFLHGTPTIGAVSLTVTALISVLLLCTGLFGLEAADPNPLRHRRHTLDSVITILAAAYMAWVLAIRSLVTGPRPDHEQLSLVTGLIAAAAIVGTATHTWSRPSVADRSTTMRAVAGVVLVGLASGIGVQAYDSGHVGAAILVMSLQTFGAVLCAHAGAGSGVRHDTSHHVPRIGPAVVPVAIAAALGTGVSHLVRDGHFHADEAWGFVALTALALSRQGIALIENQRLASTLVASVDHLRHQSTHDALTDLPNRATVIADLAHLRDDISAGAGGGLGVLFVNVDRFQQINDTLGHDRGDTLLRVVADRLRELVGDRDVLGRPSGDEFLLACAAPTARAVEHLADAILDSIRRPIDLGGTELVTTASIGTVWHASDDLATSPPAPELLLQQADLALHAAKQTGRARHHRFEPTMLTDTRRRMSLAAELRQAVLHDEFEVYYQPLVTLADRRICGAEALLRWNHPERGVLTPDQFLDVAIETGLLATVGRRTLSESCRRFSVLNRSLTDRPVHIAVNLSTAELLAPDLTDGVESILRSSGLPPELLVLEVSEEIVADPVSVAVLEELHALGVHLSIDDFGTGYSSLRQLRQFPASEVKIDRSFVAGVVDDPADRTIVSAVCDLGAGLGLGVLAEGVETDAQAAALVELGCPRAQGWLFGRPQPFSRFVATLRAQPAPEPAADPATEPAQPVAATGRNEP